MTRRPARTVPAGSVQRVRPAHVDWVDARLGDRDRAIITTVAQLRLASSFHLERLHFGDVAPSVRSRIRRRVLARLVAWRVLLTLDRRIGGVRAGSSGLVFALDAVGHQLAARAGRAARRPREPSVALLGHTLAATELYVALVERSRAGDFTVADYRTEPACWQPLPLGGYLKPDAYLRLATPAYDDHWWIEVDKGTEHLPVIRRKLRTYVDYAHSGGLGPTGVLPRLLITTPGEARRAAIAQIIEHLPDASTFAHVITEMDAPGYVVRLLWE